MFTDYYQLKELPFQYRPDIRYQYNGGSHADTLTKLEYFTGHHDGGLLTITGDLGAGKSLALAAASIPTIGITTPNDYTELLQLTCAVLEIQPGTHKTDCLIALANESGRVIAIDEAQLLDAEILEQFRLLIDSVGIRLVLAGTDLELSESLAERVVIQSTIEPLTADQVGSYISHRLKVAGCDRSIFTTDATQLIAEKSAGIPRRINRICDSALLYGFSAGSETINAELLAGCEL